ncbi:MAG TPA: glycosyltransferase family 1 protein [Acidimicrobiia bacterium]|nr:glycosyltransferase family 1 protein [Acidimicrobiia bacterium]
MTGARQTGRISIAVHGGQLLQPVPGGIGRYIRAILERLGSVGIDAIAFAAGARPPGLAPNVPWIDLGRPHGSVRYELWHRLRRGAPVPPADLVHAPSLAVPPAGRTPLVVTVHDIAFMRIPHVTTSRGVRFHTRGLDIARRDATLIIVPSAFTRRELEREGFAPDRLQVAQFGVDPPVPRDPEELAATVERAGVRPPYVLTVGTLEPRKDLRTISDAVAQLRTRYPSLTFVAVGPRGWKDVSGLDRSFVRVLGEQPWRVVDALYRRAEAFCVASLYEGFGLPALEAMARGVPTIVTTGSAMEEFVHGAGMLFAPGDVDACVQAIDRVLNDERYRDELRRASRARAAELTWDRSAEAHARAYARALTRAHS